jgi:hypothetical protein
MIDIAKKLKAKVQGDEGEVYEKTTGNKITSKPIANNSIELEKKKTWWKFW